MFNKNNFCHIASNNRNEKKAGVFVYKTTDDLATVATSGYFNDKIIDINLHDLIIHEWHDAIDRTKVQKNVLCVVERTLDNVGTVVIKSKWDGDIEQAIADLQTYVDNTFVRKDGTSIMTAPLKFMSGSMRGAVGPYLNGVGFWKLDSDANLTLIATLSDSQFIPTTTNAIDLGSSTKEWKDLYLSGNASIGGNATITGKSYINTINNGGDIAVPTSAGTMALMSDIAFKSTDVELTSPVSGQFLMYDGNKWINTTQGYANTDLSNLTATGQNIANWSSNVTNCITEIPQDIKLELSSGTLTLKAGSKVYVPNGSDTFDVVTIANDISLTATWGTNEQVMIAVNPTGTELMRCGISGRITSGTTAPTATNYQWWYDTTNNLIKVYNSGAWTNATTSFPIAIVTVPSDNTAKVNSIDQVFNGFGYIGSTVFALPGVKCVIPDGRNPDGTLKNIYYTTTEVRTRNNITYSQFYSKDRVLCIQYNGVVYNDESSNYNEVLNKHPQTAARADVGIMEVDNNGITSLTPKTAFHAVDYSDSDYIANCAMPSGKRANLTFGASGTSYTAPGDGYFVIEMTATSSSSYCTVVKGDYHIADYSGNLGIYNMIIPVAKDQPITISYGNCSIFWFYFEYANGSI